MRCTDLWKLTTALERNELHPTAVSHFGSLEMRATNADRLGPRASRISKLGLNSVPAQIQKTSIVSSKKL